MFAMFFNVVFAVFVCYPAAFCQLCFYNKDWIGLDKVEVFSCDMYNHNGTVTMSVECQGPQSRNCLSRNIGIFLSLA